MRLSPRDLSLWTEEEEEEEENDDDNNNNNNNNNWSDWNHFKII
jgi:hypothetical protein